MLDHVCCSRCPLEFVIQLCETKLEEVGAREAELPTLQRKASELLLAGDAEIVTSSPEFKHKMAQLEASKTSACAKDSAGIDQLNESILALRKTALAVPLVQVNLLDSKILSEEPAAAAEEMQRMLGDSMKLVNCNARLRAQR